jgi:hypothetical protein
LIASLEDATGGKAVEVECSQRACDAERARGLLTADRSRLANDPVVGAAPDRLVEQADGGNVGNSCVIWHWMADSITVFRS